MKKKHHNDNVKKENADQQIDEVKEQEQAEPVKTTEPSAAELKDQLLRLAAEYQNYQKRTIRQIEQAGQYAAEHFAKNLLPVLDNFQHALDKGMTSNDVASVMQGLHIVFDHLHNTLESAGMKKIRVNAGEVFDPARHEALLHVESEDIESGHIVAELAPGFEMNDRTLRPAKVSVAKPKAQADDQLVSEDKE
ncbi:MAG: nucleotide exchange factor GrpE [Sedimentisphaerales bacterium]|nr:nucleotide exchange factor GrpE [Sedimentisphaerales bacterium]MBN2843803.1 nucleotide exchange factor GrpE [Sedimentisphaerales bacterium]